MTWMRGKLCAAPWPATKPSKRGRTRGKGRGGRGQGGPALSGGVSAVCRKGVKHSSCSSLKCECWCHRKEEK